jgi:hypothetical protein
MKEDKIISLITREITGELNQEEKAQIDQLNHDKSFLEDRQAYQESWNAAGSYGSDFNLDVDKAFNEFKSKFNIPDAVETSSIMSREMRSLFLKVTVAVTILIVGFFAFKWLTAENSTIKNHSNQIKSIPLFSKTVLLSPGAELAWENSNISELKGRIQIQTEDTNFNMIYEEISFSNQKRNDDALIEFVNNGQITNIKFLEGDFVIEKDGEEIMMYEGEMIDYDLNSGLFSGKSNPSLFVDLNTKTLSFNETPLALVFKELQSYFGVKFIIEEEIPVNCHFTAQNMKDPSINDVLAILHTSFNLGVKRNGIDEFIIYNISCK